MELGLNTRKGRGDPNFGESLYKGMRLLQAFKKIIIQKKLWFQYNECQKFPDICCSAVDMLPGTQDVAALSQSEVNGKQGPEALNSAEGLSEISFPQSLISPPGRCWGAKNDS